MQIKTGDMATVIGIFENQYENNKPLSVVKPGTRQEDFYINDTVQTCFHAFRINKCQYYSSSNKNSYSILKLQKCLKARL